MPIWFERLALATAVVGLLGFGSAAAQDDEGRRDGRGTRDATVASQPRAGDIIPGRYFVRFADDERDPEGLARSFGRERGFRVVHTYRRTVKGMVIEIPEGEEIPALDTLRFDRRVRAIGNDRYIAALAQSVAKGVNRIESEPGAGANSGAGVRVAVVDTGLDFAHSDLAANIDQGDSVSCINGGGSCFAGGQDDNGHGTFVGGIIAALNNSSDLVGVASDAELVAVKVLDQNGSGSFTDVIAGLDYLTGLNSDGDATNDVDVVNMSLGATCSVCTENSSDPVINAFQSAIEALVASGATVVVAAGNEASDSVSSVPAAFDAAIAVSALYDRDGRAGEDGGCSRRSGCDEDFAYFSNYGADVDVIAPGMSESSLNLGGGTATGSGTSFAAPHAAGVAAVFIAAQATRPAPATVAQALIETGECAKTNGNGFHDGFGCTTVWDKDPDGIAEPLVRAENVTSFIAPLALTDAAVTSVKVVESPITDGDTVTVNVGVTNNGNAGATIDVDLAVDPANGTIWNASTGCGNPCVLGSGAAGTVAFEWETAAASTGSFELAATVVLAGDEVPGNDTLTAAVDVLAPIHDVAVLDVSAPGTVTQGETAVVEVTVKNTGTEAETFEVQLADIPSGGGAPGAVDGPAAPCGGDNPCTLTLAAGVETSLAFAWDTAAAGLGDRTLEAVVTLTSATDAAPGNDTQTTASTVVEAPSGPTVSSCDPASGSRRERLTVDVHGDGFQNGANVDFGSRVSVRSISFVAADLLQVSISIGRRANAGPRQVSVTNPDGSSAALNACFTVN